MRTGTLRNTAALACGVVIAITMLTGCGKSGPQAPEPVVSLAIDPTAVVRGSLVTIRWSAVNATECLASGEWYGKRPVSGSETYTSGANGMMPFTLTCTGAGGPVEKTVKLKVYRAISPPQ